MTPREIIGAPKKRWHAYIKNDNVRTCADNIAKDVTKNDAPVPVSSHIYWPGSPDAVEYMQEVGELTIRFYSDPDRIPPARVPYEYDHVASVNDYTTTQNMRLSAGNRALRLYFRPVLETPAET